MKKKRPQGTGPPWAEKPADSSATRDGTPELVSGAKLPVTLWRRNFWFRGAPNEDLHRLSSGRFAARFVPGATHPVFVLRPLDHGVGATVCPCSSQPPFGAAIYRLIRRGCQLRHTGHIMDRASHLIEGLAFTLPSSLAWKLSFMGEVPDSCIICRERK